VCRPIAVVSKSDNYGVAPIVVERTVIGMVHADCFFQRRAVHSDECDALAVVAETLAAHLGRLLLLDQLQAIRQAPGRLWSAPPPAAPEASSPLPASGEFAPGPVPMPVPGAPSAPGPLALPHDRLLLRDPLPARRFVTQRETRERDLEGRELTSREVDVIRLMAAGETNYRIARLLDITEGTAKTHVSNILQKLDAANRAQAVSRWLRT
jgi:DNA-binding CsgD family transcriptional regulator